MGNKGSNCKVVSTASRPKDPTFRLKLDPFLYESQGFCKEQKQLTFKIRCMLVLFLSVFGGVALKLESKGVA